MDKIKIKHRPTMLMILDGFGVNKEAFGNAIAQASKPNIDRLFKDYPNTTLEACGLAVGLPQGQMGNSEVGHLNIGAGRIVYQELTRITKEISEGNFFKNKTINKAMDNAIENNSSLHLLGLLSDGGVHSHIDHLLALLKMAKEKGLSQVYIHGFLDGRDVPPRCAKKYVDQLNEITSKLGIGKLSTLSGRYYAMDRDKRWDRVKLAYDAMTLGKGQKSLNGIEAIDNGYSRDENDEFLLPTIIDSNDKNQFISDRDSVIMFNFRPDRAREITRALVDPKFDGFIREKEVNHLTYVCLTQYDSTMPNVSVAYPPEKLTNTFGQYISSLGLTQLRIAETEKYAHVTFFFNGGIEEPVASEDRILVDSPKVATYDLQPEMSAPLVTEKVIEAIRSEKYDSIILNFANPDMVGHTGNLEATIKAIETLDSLVGQIEKEILKLDGQILLTADHGNADVMIDEDGRVVTSHSLNIVPLIHISNHPSPLKSGGKLCDLAPTLLDLMGLDKPKEMTGQSLLEK